MTKAALHYADVNECLIPNFDGCVHARCANTVGSYTCVCDDGFVTDGENNCTGINYDYLSCIAININMTRALELDTTYQ